MDDFEAHLDVGRSKVHDPVSVAAYLADLFPYIDRVVSEWWSTQGEDGVGTEGSEQVMRWRTVEELVPHFVKVRMQERKVYVDEGYKAIMSDDTTDLMAAVAEHEEVRKVRERLRLDERSVASSECACCGIPSDSRVFGSLAYETHLFESSVGQNFAMRGRSRAEYSTLSTDPRIEHACGTSTPRL